MTLKFLIALEVAWWAVTFALAASLVVDAMWGDGRESAWFAVVCVFHAAMGRLPLLLERDWR